MNKIRGLVKKIEPSLIFILFRDKLLSRAFVFYFFSGGAGGISLKPWC